MPLDVDLLRHCVAQLRLLLAEEIASGRLDEDVDKHLWQMEEALAPTEPSDD